MNYLAIDTSGTHLTIVLIKNEQVFSEFIPDGNLKHSITLMPAVEKIAEQAQFDFNTADFFCAVVGAGSFTGIRIGVATVKALCFAFNKPCLSITSFDTLAYNKKDGKVLALIDAKHNGFYACGYENGAVVISPAYLMRDEVEKLSDYQFVAIAPIDGMQVETVSVVDGLISAIESKIDCVSQDIDELVPLYVRKSQAEEGR